MSRIIAVMIVASMLLVSTPSVSQAKSTVADQIKAVLCFTVPAVCTLLTTSATFKRGGKRF